MPTTEDAEAAKTLQIQISLYFLHLVRGHPLEEGLEVPPRTISMQQADAARIPGPI